MQTGEDHLKRNVNSALALFHILESSHSSIALWRPINGEAYTTSNDVLITTVANWPKRSTQELSKLSKLQKKAIMTTSVIKATLIKRIEIFGLCFRKWSTIQIQPPTTALHLSSLVMRFLMKHHFCKYFNSSLRGHIFNNQVAAWNHFGEIVAFRIPKFAPIRMSPVEIRCKEMRRI